MQVTSGASTLQMLLDFDIEYRDLAVLVHNFQLHACGPLVLIAWRRRFCG
jgi:hypothetical protein